MPLGWPGIVFVLVAVLAVLIVLFRNAKPSH